jgi:hypothetical protein
METGKTDGSTESEVVEKRKKRQCNSDGIEYRTAHKNFGDSSKALETITELFWV